MVTFSKKSIFVIVLGCALLLPHTNTNATIMDSLRSAGAAFNRNKSKLILGTVLLVSLALNASQYAENENLQNSLFASEKDRNDCHRYVADCNIKYDNCRLNLINHLNYKEPSYGNYDLDNCNTNLETLKTALVIVGCAGAGLSLYLYNKAKKLAQRMAHMHVHAD